MSVVGFVAVQTPRLFVGGQAATTAHVWVVFCFDSKI